MSEQGKIREGIHIAIQGGNITVVGESCEVCRSTERVLEYLHSQGVVIVSQSEKENHSPTISRGRHKVAVEPLIDDVFMCPYCHYRHPPGGKHYVKPLVKEIE